MEEIDNENEILLNKLNSLQKKILDYLNVKFKINITGKEINIDLNNKNIGNIDLMLLTSILSDNLEYINLSHNRISDIRPLKDLKKVKKIDLSFNNLKDYSINSINDIRNDILKDNLSFRKKYFN
jgi:Leucine-rich repeat (LRR) protein